MSKYSITVDKNGRVIITYGTIAKDVVITVYKRVKP